jgi:prepilin peptidase CpaA
MSVLALPVLTISGAYAAWMDAGYRRLPNQLVIVVGVLGLAANFYAGGGAQFGSSLIHALVALGIGLALFSLRVIGGGDGKYYAAVACWFPLPHAILLLGWVSLIGFFLAVGFFAARFLRRRKGEGAAADNHAREVPFGIAIALGAVCTSYWLLA